MRYKPKPTASSHVDAMKHPDGSAYLVQPVNKAGQPEGESFMQPAHEFEAKYDLIKRSGGRKRKPKDAAPAPNGNVPGAKPQVGAHVK